MPDKINTNPDSADRNKSPAGINLQIRYKVSIAFALLLLVVTSAFWLIFQNELNRSLNQYSDYLGTSLAEQSASSVRELVLVNDPLGLNVVLNQLVSDNNINFATVFDVDGRQLASAGQKSPDLGNQATNPVLYSANITVQDAIAGSVQLELDARARAGFQSRMRNLFLLVLVVSLILVTTTAFALTGGITNALKAVRESIASKTGIDEPGDIADIENEVVNLQLCVENLLSHYQEMEEQLLETGIWQSPEQEANNEPSRLAASIFVVKVVNINTAIELLHPPTLANLLREYINYLNQAASLYGGKFQRLSGDSALLCFDSNHCSDRHSINAIHCAGLFQSIMTAVNNRHKKNGEQILEFRMAIHSGDIFLAPEILNTESASVSVLGKTIDITYFLCKQTSPNELLISDSACSHARTFDEIQTTGQNEVSMPADNVAFMAYILSNNFAAENELIRKQCEHILNPTHKSEKSDL